MKQPFITIITPTTGKDGLFKLSKSLKSQSVPYIHMLLWDDKREDKFLYPDPNTLKTMDPNDMDDEGEMGCTQSLVLKGNIVQGPASGSALRAIGLMAAQTPLITFADDDVWYEENHLSSLVEASKDKKWAYCVRKIWSPKGDYIGEDRFESVGDDPERKVPYEMVDNNSMIFDRKFGASAAVLYRETKEYNDDRLMYSFLKKHGGSPGKTYIGTVNQVSPVKLIDFFRRGCK